MSYDKFPLVTLICWLLCLLTLESIMLNKFSNSSDKFNAFIIKYAFDHNMDFADYFFGMFFVNKEKDSNFVFKVVGASANSKVLADLKRWG